MTRLWSRGGLSWRELIYRTSRESWEDEVFGQAARLAFYHFLALFPALLLLLVLLLKFAVVAADLQNSLLAVLQQILPDPVFSLLSGMVQELNGKARLGGSLFPGLLASVWASINGTWAMMRGLNTAYEVEERRPLWKIVLIAMALTITLAVLGLLSLVLLFFGGHMGEAFAAGVDLPHKTMLLVLLVRWPVLIAILLTAFAILYRFAPNLFHREWQWSTPGAVVALTLWVGASLLLRAYFTLSHSYEQIYGHLAAVSMLLMWLYLTSAAILIGGEMNSEIEKAADHKPKQDGALAKHQRSGT
ncbi:MAG: YihY/virulence factor BrkB family protein [Acidobacteriaceae bacterium]|nr:YihY/virulence factor BrkB family protein [Acidobacteriaceae bacterium]